VAGGGDGYGWALKFDLGTQEIPSRRRKKEMGKIVSYPEHLTSTCEHLRMMISASCVLINSGGGLSATYGGEDIFLPRMKTTMPPRKKQRGKVL
jgi:hypothetical protein